MAKFTQGPARILGLDTGSLEVGSPADITVFDPDYAWTVDVGQFYTRGKHSPFAGRELKGKAVITIVAGRIVMKNGEVTI